MPYAAHEVCLVQITTPEAPDDHRYLGDCGGWVHGMCGDAEQEGENKIHGDFPPCIAAKQSSQAPASKYKFVRSVSGRGDLEAPRKQRQQ